MGGVHVSEHLSFTCLGKASRGKPRPKPESGNPTFRDCRGARGNVTLSFDKVRAARLYPDRDRLSGAGLKPPQAAVVKSHGGVRWRKSASTTRAGEHPRDERK